mgnify:CR=1 FL=1
MKKKCIVCSKPLHRFIVTGIFDLLGKQLVYFCENKKCIRYGLLDLAWKK